MFGTPARKFVGAVAARGLVVGNALRQKRNRRQSSGEAAGNELTSIQRQRRSHRFIHEQAFVCPCHTLTRLQTPNHVLTARIQTPANSPTPTPCLRLARASRWRAARLADRPRAPRVPTPT